MAIYEQIWKQMKEQSRILNERIDQANLNTERSGVAYQFPSSALVDAPTGMTASENRFITDGRKSGEGAGTGTGVPCYWDVASSSWLKFSDDMAVTV